MKVQASTTRWKATSSHNRAVNGRKSALYSMEGRQASVRKYRDQGNRRIEPRSRPASERNSAGASDTKACRKEKHRSTR